MKHINTTEQLKHLAKTNPVATAIFQSFVNRERTRSVLFTRILRRRLIQEGSGAFPIGDVAEVLSTLAKLGFGEVQKSSRGTVLSLKNITTTLQSIGQVALSNNGNVDLTHWQRRNKATPLVADTTPKTTPGVVLTIMMHGKPVNVSIPKGLQAGDLTQIVTKLNELAL